MREEVLHQKINSLQAFIDQARETSDNGWLTLIDEDRLLSRIDFLEKQSNLNSKVSKVKYNSFFIPISIHLHTWPPPFIHFLSIKFIYNLILRIQAKNPSRTS